MSQYKADYVRVTHPFAGRLKKNLITPRLACIRPVASVHPELGSNSPYYQYKNI